MVGWRSKHFTMTTTRFLILSTLCFIVLIFGAKYWVRANCANLDSKEKALAYSKTYLHDKHAEELRAYGLQTKLFENSSWGQGTSRCSGRPSRSHQVIWDTVFEQWIIRWRIVDLDSCEGCWRLWFITLHLTSCGHAKWMEPIFVTEPKFKNKAMRKSGWISHDEPCPDKL